MLEVVDFVYWKWWDFCVLKVLGFVPEGYGCCLYVIGVGLYVIQGCTGLCVLEVLATCILG